MDEVHKELDAEWAKIAAALELPNAGRVSFTELLLSDQFDVTDPCWQPGWVAVRSSAPQPLESGALGSGRADVRGMASDFMSQRGS